ncbi:type II secretion system protein GspL, partial [Thauera linaloolentis]
MKSRLTLLVPEHWPQTPECEWQLSDRDGRTAQRGRSAPRHWPRADEHVAILDGAQTSLLTITVPPSKRKDRPALIAYALEARLAREVDQEHVTIVADTAASAGANPDARQLAVLVAGTARLRQVCAQFDTLQRPLHRAVSIFECLAASPECWQLASGDGRSAALRTGTGSAIAFDLPQRNDGGDTGGHGQADDDGRVEAIAAMLDFALRDAGSPPQRIELAFTPALPAECCDTLAHRTGVALQPLGFDAVWARSAQAHTLLHGGFAPKVGVGASLWTTLRWPALAAGTALALAGIAMAAGVLADRGEAARLA